MPSLLEAEPLLPQDRAEVIMYIAEHSPAYDFMVAGRTGFGLAATLDSLHDMTANGELVTTVGNDFRINPDSQHQTYANALPYATDDQLTHLDEVCERPNIQCLLVFGATNETVYGPLKLAVKTELYARAKRAERQQPHP